MIDSLPPEKPAFRPHGAKPAAGPKDYKPKRSFGTERPVRSGTGAGNFAPAKFASGTRKFESAKGEPGRPVGSPSDKPAWKKDDRATRPPARFAPRPGGDERLSRGRSQGDRPAAERTYGTTPPAGRTFGNKPAARTYPPRPGGKPLAGKPGTGRGFPSKPAWKKPEAQQWPPYRRPPAPTPEATRHPVPEPNENTGLKKPTRLHIEPVHEFERTNRTAPVRTGQDRKGPSRPSFNRPPSGRSTPGRSEPDRSRPDRSEPGRSAPGRSAPARPGTGRSSSERPFRTEGGLARPFTTSSGKPRPGGARPSSKPGKPAERSHGPGTERRTGSGWKPKPSEFSRSGSKGSGPKGKPGGAKRSGPRPGGKRPGPPRTRHP
jgi:hypothetical protein